MIYQAGPIKRKRRTKAQVEQLNSQIIEVLERDHPQSIRHVFYRMPKSALSVTKVAEESEREGLLKLAEYFETRL